MRVFYETYVFKRHPIQKFLPEPNWALDLVYIDIGYSHDPGLINHRISDTPVQHKNTKPPPARRVA